VKPYYQDDKNGIVIYNGDCREILPHLEPVDLVLTDPPYGLGEKLHTGGTWSTHPKYDAMLVWDKKIDQSFARSLCFLAPKVIMWGGNYYELPPSRCWLSWVKNNNVPTMADFELAWTNYDRPSKACRGRIHPDGINQHPTQKPLYLMKFCIDFDRESQTILDPFMGSGTTLVAAKQLGRKAIGIEICEAYCQIAVQRLQQEVLCLEPAKKENKDTGNITEQQESLI